MLPEGLIIDTFEGSAYIGLLLLDEIDLTSPFYPGCLVDLYHAVNVRTYVRPKNNLDECGIYFLSLNVDTIMAAFSADMIFNLGHHMSKLVRKWSKHPEPGW